jgi:hypothetical protein
MLLSYFKLVFGKVEKITFNFILILKCMIQFGAVQSIAGAKKYLLGAFPTFVLTKLTISL